MLAAQPIQPAMQGPDQRVSLTASGICDQLRSPLDQDTRNDVKGALPSFKQSETEIEQAIPMPEDSVIKNMVPRKTSYSMNMKSEEPFSR